MLQKSLLAIVLSAVMGITATVVAQTDQSAESSNPQQDQQIQVTPMNQTPVYRVQVVERTTDAIDYRHRASSTIDIHGTSLDPNITGRANVDSKNGHIAIDAKLNHMNKPESYGPQYLTYVLWAITPEGRPSNLGEVLPNDDGNAELHVTTNLQAFGLIITAEPYFAVTAPSNLVVADNVITQKTKGWAQPIHARFEAVNRTEYTIDIPASELPATAADRKTVPLELLEARNAVTIARATGARQYAPDALDKAENFLTKGEDYLNRKQPKSAIATVARYATQQAEDARLLTIRDKRQEQAEKERQQIQQRAENAEQQANEAQQRAQEAHQRAEDEATRAKAAQDQLQQTQQQTQETQQQLAQAQQELAQAQAAQQAARQEAQQAAQQRAAAEQARQQALIEQQNLRQQAQQAQMQAQTAEMQREQTRQKLLSQLNQVLQTKDTARGLIVNMSDVLFDFNRASLKPGAKVRLAKVAGILLAYPDLHLRIEGYTDNIGTPSYNMQLSDRRAATVRDYLVSQGVPASNVTAEGFGESDPVASNATAAGRQMNRRVDLVVSGQSIEARQETPGGPAGTPGASASGTVTGTRTTQVDRSYQSSSTTDTTQPTMPSPQPTSSVPPSAQPMQQQVPSTPASNPPPAPPHY